MKFTFFKRHAVAGLLMAVAFMPLSQIAIAQTKTLQVKMANTSIFVEPSMTSAKIATAQAGDMLESLEDAGKFYKVKTAKGETGYVPRMNVTDSKPAAPPPPPGKGDGELDDLVGSLGGQRVARLEEGSSSHSIRGKTAAGAQKGVISRAGAAESVSAMEKFAVSADDVKAFRKEGGLDASN
jgi:uncharacterized protein YgiM (DUF1202 family)